MVSRVMRAIRTYPVTFWAATGITLTFFNQLVAATYYTTLYEKWDLERRQELERVGARPPRYM
jgi:hypothetical protein